MKTEYEDESDLAWNHLFGFKKVFFRLIFMLIESTRTEKGSFTKL